MEACQGSLPRCSAGLGEFTRIEPVTEVGPVYLDDGLQRG